MSLKEKLDHTVEDIKGKAKEALGHFHNDDKLEREGKTDQAKSSLKDAGTDLKDGLKKI